jgi:hypothetical protein
MGRSRNLSKLAKNTTNVGTLSASGGGGGGSFADANNVIMKNNTVVTSNVVADANLGLTSTGPITIANNVTVTIPASSRWVVL